MTPVGTGTHRYEFVKDWPKPPPGETFGAVSSVATDAQDRLYVFQRRDPPVLIFDRDGSYVDCWGTGVISDPHGCNIVDDVIYLTDRMDSVALIFTLDGRLLQMLGERGVHSETGCEKGEELVPHAAGPFNWPTKLVPSPSGDLYVSDGYRNARVHRFSQDGRLTSSWGRPGKSAPYEFHMPHSLTVDSSARVCVCDRDNNRIQVFSSEGEFLSMWTDIHRPVDVVIDSAGTFYVNELDPDGPARESTHPRMSVLDADGGVLARWDTRYAHGVCVDTHGNIYLALSHDSSVDKYIRQQ